VSPEQEMYRSKQFQVNDSAREERALNSRKAVKKEEAASVASKERDGGTVLIGSPFQRGVACNQQIEIAKLQAVRSFEERRSADSDYSTQLTHLH
jgi:hypothetical protein